MSFSPFRHRSRNDGSGEGGHGRVVEEVEVQLSGPDHVHIRSEEEVADPVVGSRVRMISVNQSKPERPKDHSSHADVDHIFQQDVHLVKKKIIFS
jgi:hypothetical protein